MNFLKLGIVFILLAGSIVGISKKSNQKNMTELIHVRDSIYYIVGQGGNIGALVGKEGILLVDDQFAHLHDDILKQLSKISSLDVSYVVNTHWHVDHTNGNEKFGEKGSTIIAQKNSAIRMQTPQKIEVFNHTQQPYTKAGLPKVQFDKNHTFTFNKQTIHLVAAPNAHTDGDLIVHFKEANVIHTGDVFVTYGYPFIDTPNGGSIQGVLKAINYLLSISDEETRFIPGHGSVSSKKEIIAYKEMLETILNRITTEKDKGKNPHEILLTHPTRGFSSEKINEEIFVNIVLGSL